MSKLLPILLLLTSLGLAGCRLSREPEGLAPAPTPAVTEAQPLGPPPPEAPEGVANEVPELNAPDYLKSLTEELTAAREQGQRGELEQMSRPQGPLALAQVSLSLLEAKLPAVMALHELERAGRWIADQKKDEAAKVMDELIIRLEPELRKSPGSVGVTIDGLQGVIKLIVASKFAEASQRIEVMMESLASLPALQETREIRVDLEECESAAARKRAAPIDGLLADALARATRLQEMLGQTAVSE